MQRSFSSKKSAFSLIELAIVLIIIGLLIAGITGGAALIKSAELRAAVTEARSNSISVSAFYSLYDSLPGDSNKVTLAAGNQGNGDGKMEFCVGSTFPLPTACALGTTLALSEGGGGAWAHLRDAGIVNFPNLTTVVSSSAQVLGGNTPSFLASKIKSAGWMYDYDDSFSRNVAVLTPGGVVLAGDLASNVTAHSGYSIISGADLFSIDAKNDDGNAAKGRIRAQGQTLAAGVVVTDCTSNTTGTYDMVNAAKTCTMVYDLDLGV